MRDVNFFERELARLDPRFDVFDEMQIRFFRVRIVCVARHGDVATGGFLVERGGEFTPIEQPTLERRHGFAIGRAPFQLVEKRLDLRPVAESMFCGTNFRGLYGGNLPKGSKFMRTKDRENRRDENEFVPLRLAFKHDADETPFPPKFVVRHFIQTIERIAYDHFGVSHFQHSYIVVNQETKFGYGQGEAGFF